MTELLGRSAVLASVRELVPQWPLVTITGPGGVGKTTLAHAVVDEIGSAFPDGVVWCDLVPASGGSAVGDLVATALGFPSPEAAVEGLGDTHRLIILDNCEHVVEEAAELAGALVKAGPGLRIVATSREALGTPDEHVIALRGLDSETAVALLERRADRAGADLSTVARADLEALCAWCDGLPLAIELAASRLRTLSPAELLGDLDDRLGILSRARGAHPRHQSLRAALSWSLDLLSRPERKLFARLGVFPRTFSLDAAVEVASRGDRSAAVDGIDRLVAQSMVVAEPGAGGQPTRFRLLESLRELAVEQLRESGEESVVRERWLALLEAKASDIVARGAETWDQGVVDELFATIDDLALGIGASPPHDGDPTRAQTMYLPAWGVVHHNHASRFAHIGDELLDRWPPGEGPLTGDVAATCATAHLRIGDLSRAAELSRTAVDNKLPGLYAPVIGRRALALVAQHRGDFDEALELLDAAIDSCEELGLTPFICELQTLRGLVLGQRGDLEEGLAVAREGAHAAEAERSVLILPWSTAVAGRLMVECDRDEGTAQLERALELQRDLFGPLAVDSAGLVRQALGIARFGHGARREAAVLFREALQHFALVGDQVEVWNTVRWSAVLVADEQPHAARRLLDSADAHAAAPALTELERPISEVRSRLLAGEPPMGRLASREAVAEASELLEALVHGDEIAPAAQPAVKAAAMRRSGDVWTLAFGDAEIQLREAKGLYDLRMLISRQGSEVHCLELMGAAVDQASAGPDLDGEARRAYEQRIRELQDDLAEAEANNDAARAERAGAELDVVVAELSHALGLGGRDRRRSDSTERARQAVSWRIRAVIRRIEQEHQGLAHHLRRSVRTGTWCAYEPEQPITWSV